MVRLITDGDRQPVPAQYENALVGSPQGGAKPEAARRRRGPPAEMPLGGGAVKPADVAYICEALGGRN